MALFPVTERSDIDLATAKGQGKQFSLEALQRMKVQENNYQKAQKQKEKILSRNKLIAKSKKQEMDFQKKYDTTFSISSSIVILAIIAYLVLKK